MRLVLKLRHVAFLIFGFSLSTVFASFLAADPKDSAPATHDAKAALGEFNSLIGEWRGIGQPKRNSADGAWSEKAEWIWDFHKEDKEHKEHKAHDHEAVAIKYDVKSGKFLTSATITWDAKAGVYHLTATLPDKSTREYSGKSADGRIILESQPDDAGETHRLTITRLNEKRTLVLFETRRKGSTMFARVAEVGYTREGTKLAVEGAGEIECVVTGGKGTIPVTYQGKTYYVCCTGCKQAFEDDPEGILAEYKQRLADRANGKSDK